MTTVSDPIRLPTSTSPRVSVIVPSSTRTDLLLAGLRALERNAPKGVPFEVIVVLNASPATAERRLRETVSGVSLVPSPVHVGLAGAANRGRAYARGEFLVLLHDDAEVEAGWLEALVEAADANPHAGAVGSKVLDLDGTLQNAGMILWNDGRTSPPWIGYPPSPASFDRRRAVDYCGTSSLLVRAATWDAFGGPDERFFPLYYVDVDLAMSVRRAGQVVLFEPRSVIRHHRSASTKRRFREWVTARNRALFIEKWQSELTRQEPNGSESVEAMANAIANALARAEAAGEEARVRAADASVAGPEPAPFAFDAAAQERQALERDVALHRDYVHDLTTALASPENADDPLVQISSSELEELRALAAHLARIQQRLPFRVYRWLRRFLSPPRR